MNPYSQADMAATLQQSYTVVGMKARARNPPPEASSPATVHIGRSSFTQNVLKSEKNKCSVKAGSWNRRAAHIARNASEDGAGALPDPAKQDAQKRAVARQAAQRVKNGMIVGLGTGSTSCMAIEELGNLTSSGKLKDVTGVATSYQARVLARQFGVKTVDLNDVNHVDIAIDGADEVDPQKNLIKGGGAAHTMEKVVAAMAKETIIIIDESKVVKELGLSFPVAVEVLPYAISPVLRSLAALGGAPEIRSALKKDGPVITDLGNMVVDVSFDGIKDPAALERDINMIPGVIENGLFVGIVQTVLVGVEDGSVVELAEYMASLSAAV